MTMNNIKVHVESYDESTNSLVVYFSCLEDEKIIKTSSFAFQTHNYNVDNVNDLINILGTIGKGYLEQEKQKLNFSSNESLIEQLKNINNSEFEVVIPDLPPPPVNNGEIIDDLEVII